MRTNTPVTIGGFAHPSGASPAFFGKTALLRAGMPVPRRTSPFCGFSHQPQRTAKSVTEFFQRQLQPGVKSLPTCDIAVSV